MKIVHTPPPNYKEIQKYFPEADYNKGILFTYGDTCYCKSITPDLVAHEETHTRQQKDPEQWWNRYFKDPEFRLSQETEAYHNQWIFIDKNIKDRNEKARMLHFIALSLSGKLYNNLVTYNEAVSLIKGLPFNR